MRGALPRAMALVLLLAAGVEAASGPAESPGPAITLYHQLRELGLDPARVYRVHDLAIDRSDVHITLNSGTLAFSQSVAGRVTGAFFDGDGEILLVPPNRVERASMTLFTGSPILEERFSTAFFRFTDDTLERLQPALRPAEDAVDFIARWDPSFRELCSANSFALLRFLTWRDPNDIGASPGFFWDARIAGLHLGAFDVMIDSQAGEQILVGQNGYANGAPVLDIWTSFPARGTLAPQSDEGDDLTEVAHSAYRVSEYKIRAHILPSHELQADAELALEVAKTGARTLVFELSRNLKVSSVTANGAGVEFLQNESLQGSDLARRGNDLIAVVLPDPVLAGEKLQLHFAYRGSVLTDAGSGLLYVGARGTWYPNLGPAMSTFDLEFRYPAGWTLVATGKRVSSEVSSGEEVSHWVSERPIPLAGFNLGKYVSARVKAGDTVVETFATHVVEPGLKAAESELPDLPTSPRRRPNMMAPPPPLPPSPALQAQAVAQRSARAVEFLSRRLGPFPFNSLALTQMPGMLSEGWPGLVFLSSYAFLNAEERQRLQLDSYTSLLYSDLVQAHETAHQWWGDAVLWKSYRDGWLAEALANYSALLVLEQEKPDAVRTALERYRLDLTRKMPVGLAAKDAGPVTLGHRLTSSRMPEAYDIVCYGRGTWLLHMLRSMFRDADRDEPDPDARFLQVLRTVRERFDGRGLSTRDFQKAVEDALPASLRYEGRKSLAWFFDGWVNGTALPRFELAKIRFTQHGGNTIVSGTLLQKEAPDTLVTSIPLYAAARDHGKPVYLGRVFADGPETDFRLTAPPGTRTVVIDPYQTVLTHP